MRKRWVFHDARGELEQFGMQISKWYLHRELGVGRWIARYIVTIRRLFRIEKPVGSFEDDGTGISISYRMKQRIWQEIADDT